MAMKVVGAGSQTSSADANEYFVNTKFAVKASGETVTSAPNLHDDADLILHVDASKTYQVDLFVQLVSNATAQFQFAFAAPAGCVLYGHAMTGLGNSGVMDGTSYDAAGNLLTTTVFMSTSGAGTHDIVTLHAILVTAGTAGNFKFRWSQVVSNVNNCTVFAGSSMIMRRVS